MYHLHHPHLSLTWRVVLGPASIQRSGPPKLNCDAVRIIYNEGIEVRGFNESAFGVSLVKISLKGLLHGVKDGASELVVGGAAAHVGGADGAARRRTISILFGPN